MGKQCSACTRAWRGGQPSATTSRGKPGPKAVSSAARTEAGRLRRSIASEGRGGWVEAGPVAEHAGKRQQQGGQGDQGADQGCAAVEEGGTGGLDQTTVRVLAGVSVEVGLGSTGSAGAEGQVVGEGSGRGVGIHGGREGNHPSR